MAIESEIQQENLLSKQIKDFLIFFKVHRGYSNRQLAEKLHYEENYLTRIRNGSVDGGEKLLHALESFFLLDNLQRIAQIDRQIMELEREKSVLRGQSVEKFYAERAVAATIHGRGGAVNLNETAAIAEAIVEHGDFKMLFSHYRKAMSRAEAEKFLTLTPAICMAAGGVCIKRVCF